MIRNRERLHHALDTRWIGRVRLAWGLITSAAIALVCAGTANADCSNFDFNAVTYNTTLPITASSPADGAAVWVIRGDSAGTITPTFSARTPLHGLGIFVEVATNNTPGRDGTLSDDYNTGFFSLHESDADPDLYTGTPNVAFFLDTPGTYYWEMHALTDDCQAVKSPVYKVTVTDALPTTTTSPPQTTTTTPPPPLPKITLADARSYAAKMVAQHTHRTPHIRLPCSRVNAWTLRCSPSWIIGSSTYRATGEFETYLSGRSVDWAYDFSGTRTWRTCTRRHGTARCKTHRQHFHWF